MNINTLAFSISRRPWMVSLTNISKHISSIHSYRHCGEPTSFTGKCQWQMKCLRRHVSLNFFSPFLAQRKSVCFTSCSRIADNSRGKMTTIALDNFQQRTSDPSYQTTFTDWEDLENKFLEENPSMRKTFETLCMSHVLKSGNMEHAKSYLSYIHRKRSRANLTTLGLFISVCGKICGRSEQDLLYKLYEEMQTISPLSNTVMLSDLVHGFSHTDRWKDCVAWIENAKELNNPKTFLYNDVIMAGLRNGDIDKVQELLDVLGWEGEAPSDVLYRTFLKFCENTHYGVSVFKLFEYMRKHRWQLSEDVADELMQHFHRFHGGKYKCRKTSVSPSGHCNSCGLLLEKLELPDDKFALLQSAILEKTLLLDNAYLRSSPEEITNFQQLLKKHAPFDVVIDTLSVMHTDGRFKVQYLKDVVDYFAVKRRAKVLLICRRSHGKLKSLIPYLQAHAQIFFTERTSKDDPFVLYAAAYSGKACHYVSRDFMRDHKSLVGPELKETFEKWQWSRQITWTDGKEFLFPHINETIVQQSENGWHVPFVSSTEEDSRSVQLLGVCPTQECSRRKTVRQKNMTHHVSYM
ncbi:mitochondrial ribonuclease P catalytic subunit-like [Haliotis rubra]|uniref:mitochondrial ribonuclease P catalytic subunit-like n=1 Tax=Haliotis rubra TaxID=36100 RepID=UPI001EE5F940|nr:mitochondrial ribonuclease P catalytic subunit-like [Haliotis rubra]XP_046561971.1 mitochondrial ribonuclease P catalytic subunit-like [Haliotis rubra]XP_046561972.1 mitochondrial ribonuclease P catalytic subunit-like [Haliotis rubra]